MSDAMNNPYANNPNQNGGNGQQPQGHPEYGAYAPNQQSQSQQQGGNPPNMGEHFRHDFPKGVALLHKDIAIEFFIALSGEFGGGVLIQKVKPGIFANAVRLNAACILT